MDPSAVVGEMDRVTTRGDILVVDDDVDMLEVLELLLRNEGYATRTALNGQQALEEVAAGMPALIILDMLMPVMDGWEFTREFRARYGGDVPIVVVTAAEHARSRGGSLDVTEVLTKPFDVGHLLRVVADHLPPRPRPVVHSS